MKRVYINLYLTFYSTDWNEPGQWELSSQRILSARECRKYILPEVYVSLSLSRRLIFSLSRLLLMPGNELIADLQVDKLLSDSASFEKRPWVI